MKKTIAPMIIVALLVACSSKEKPNDDPMVQKFQSYVDGNFNDPESYELIGFSKMDSVTFQHNIDFRRDQFNTDSIAMRKIDSLANLMGEKSNDIASYSYKWTFRAKNALGALAEQSIIAQTDQDNNIIHVARTNNEVLLNPNGFPGYKEAMTEYLMNK